MHRARLLTLFAAAAFAAAGGGLRAGAEESAPRAADAPAPASGPVLALIPDYVPAFLYEGELLSISFRVEKNPRLDVETEFRVWWRLLDQAGKELAKGEEKGTARERFAIVRANITLAAGARALEYGLESHGAPLGTGRALFVGEADPWPAGSGAVLSGLSGPNGERLILTLPERVAEVDERFKPLKWAFTSRPAAPKSVTVVGPRMSAPEVKSYLELLGGDAKIKPLDLFAAPAPAADNKGEPARPAAPTRGIFALVEAVESRVAAAAKGVDMVIIVMPQSDPEMGTDPRTYRQGLDWTIARLMAAGVKRVTIVPPLSRSVSEKQLTAYAAVCHESAQVYSGRGAALADSSKLMAEKYWAPEGASGKVTARFPNKAGQEALAELIKSAGK